MSGIELTFDGEMSELRSSLDGMKGAISDWGSSISTIGVAAFATWGATAVFDGLKAGLSEVLSLSREFIAEAAEVAQVDAKLAAVLRATGEAAGFTADELGKLAGQLQDITLFDDEAIKGAETMIATFKEIKGDEFKRTTLLALDMATVMGGDASSAASELGRSLANPLRGMQLLERQGKGLSDSQKQLVEDFVAAGDLAKAQSILLGELEGKYGGAAQAAADASGGGMMQLKNMIGDIREGIGAHLLPALDSMAPAFKFVAHEVGGALDAMFVQIGKMGDALFSSLNATGPAEKLVAALAIVENSVEHVYLEIEKTVLAMSRLQEIASHPIDSIFDEKMTAIEREYLKVQEQIQGLKSNDQAAADAIGEFRKFDAEQQQKKKEFTAPSGPAPQADSFFGDMFHGVGDKLKEQFKDSLKFGEDFGKTFVKEFERGLSHLPKVKEPKDKDEKKPREEEFHAAFEEFGTAFRRIQAAAASGSAGDKDKQQLDAAKGTQDNTAQSRATLEQIRELLAGNLTELRRPKPAVFN